MEKIRYPRIGRRHLDLFQISKIYDVPVSLVYFFKSSSLFLLFQRFIKSEVYKQLSICLVCVHSWQSWLM